MVRYMIYFSYIGTKYRGLQRQSSVKTIQGTIEQGLRCLRTPEPIRLVTSSRTDQGVHALCNTCHFDIPQHSLSSPVLPPDIITYAVNRYLWDNSEDIRILRTVQVPSTFHCRFEAVWRHYTYRVLMHQTNTTCAMREDELKYLFPVTPFQKDRVLPILDSNFDTQAFCEVASILNGTHNFSAFTAEKYFQDWQNPVKTVVAWVKEKTGDDEFPSNNVCTPTKYLDVHFRGSSFLYRQVRRMVGVMLGCGYGRLSSDQVRDMLRRPDVWRRRHAPQDTGPGVPSWALYLARVHYPQHSLVVPADEVVDFSKFSEQEDLAYNAEAPFKQDTVGSDEDVSESEATVRSRHSS